MEGNNGLHDRRRFLAGCAGGIAAAALAPASLAVANAQAARPAGISAASGDTEDIWKIVRLQFPLRDDLAYMNNGGLGPSPYPVIEALTRRMMDLDRIGESGHGFVAGVREKACRFFNCDEEELAFTRSTTEGLNIVARGVTLEPGDEILLSTHEHPGGAMPWLAVASDIGAKVKLFEPGTGGADTLDRIAAALTPRTRVLSVSHVFCTTGIEVPAARIAALCRDRGIVTVLDGAQSAGMIPVDLHALGCDFYATSGHKWLLGPKGTGMLYVHRSMLEKWRPSFVGAYSDAKYDLDRVELELLREARATEYGTRSTPLVAGLGAALDFLSSIGIERVARRGASFAAELKERIGAMDGMELLTPAECATSMVTFRPPAGTGDPWKWCNTLKKKYAIRVRPVGEHGLGAVRVSTHIYNSHAEIDRLVAALSDLAGA